MTGDSNSNVGNIVVTFSLMIIIDDTLREEECDTTMEEGQENNADGSKIGEWIGQYESEERHFLR